MKLYNSKTLKLEEFKSIEPNVVKMYVCGPTVYGHAHIGNARPIVVFDTLKRVLEANNYRVDYVSNFTDVDDKIINKAAEENTDEETITKKYIEAYEKLREILNASSLYKTPKVTENIEDIIKFIEDLVDTNHAYVIDGDVYFDIKSIDNYGSLSKQSIEELKVGARIQENTLKRNPLDFTLWKKTEKGLNWESKFSRGRPGWHTECVVMINKELGSHIDIHGGGRDLKFPHHENEVAQSCAAYHNHIANYWIHNAMINTNGEKMSKSLGNIILAKDVIEELGPQLVRFFLLSTHYRKELNFSQEAIDFYKKELEKITTIIKTTSLLLQTSNYTNTNYNKEDYNLFLEQMNEDLNTPNAYTALNTITKSLNGEMRKPNKDIVVISEKYNSLLKCLDILGIDIEVNKLSKEEIELYNNWNQAKSIKDFEKADLLREELISKGII